MKIVSSSICKIGGREYNQDYAASVILDNGACFTVCDGLGGYVGSEVASRLCATKLVTDFEDVCTRNPASAIDRATVSEYIRRAHNFVRWHKSRNSEIASSCTTVSAIFTDNKTIVAANIGDTRIYFFKEGRLAFQTRDHSLSQIAADQGVILHKDIRTHKDQNKLTRVLGSERPANPDITILQYTLNAGDSFILCSDGFWEYVYEDEMEKDLAAHNTPAAALKEMEQRILKRAPKYNDNYTAILATVVE